MQNEAVGYQKTYASILTRLFGAVVDLSIFSLLMSGVIIRIVDFPVVNFLFFMFYFGAVPFWLGGTLGQRLFGMSMVSHDSRKVSFWRLMLRSLLLLAAFWWFFYVIYHWDDYVDTTTYIEIILPFVIALIPLVTTFFNAKRQTLFDLIAGTCVVVYEKQIVTGDGVKYPKRSLLEWVRLLLKVIISGFLAYGIFTFGALFLVYGTMSLNHKRAYNKSFHEHYSPSDHNDSKIRFYVEELNAPSRDFVNAEGMYEIFAADVKRDLAGNCISYFLRQHKDDNWISAESAFKKNARSRYADTKKKISRTKENEKFLGKHFYDYDLNDVNEIESQVANIWGDANANKESCQKLLSVEKMFDIFIMRYIENREEALAQDKRDLVRAKPTGLLDRSFYQKRIKVTEAWLKMLYSKHPEYKQYKKDQKIVRQKIKEEALWRRVKEGIYYPEGFFRGVNANIFDENGETPLMVAVKRGTLERLKQLFLEADVDFHLKNKNGLDAFAQARLQVRDDRTGKAQRTYNQLRILETKKALKGKAKIMSYIYDNASDRLSIVIDRGSCSQFDLPRNTKCGVMAKKKKRKKKQWDPIYKAIIDHDDAALERLLAEGGHLEVKNSYGDSPLFYTMIKNLHAFKRLVESGADMYALGKFGHNTPLLSAVHGNDISRVKILLENGMDVNFEHPGGKRALDIAVQQCSHAEMISLLLRHDAKFGTVYKERLKIWCRKAPYLAQLKEVLEKSVEK